jgi:serine/threonine protein kinase
MNPTPLGSAKATQSSGWAHAKWVFLQVCDLEPEACRQRLDELCSNPEERKEVERLLLHDSPTSIFDDPSSDSGTGAHEAPFSSPPHSPVADDVTDPWIGRAILGYRLVKPIGEGGMGEVYRAEDTRLKRPVAVKFLATRFLRDDRQKRRFLREAQAAAALDHPSICPVYDVGEIEGRPYIVSAFVEGETLAEVMQAGDLPVATALDYLIHIAEGLEVAHRRGVVHRDMKPANVILATDGDGGVHVKIIDFGLARVSGFSELTEVGAVIGTAAYIAPEILQGQEIDPRADIWSLGVMLYEMLTGRRPFDAENRERLFYLICNEEAEPVTAVRPNLSEDAAQIVAKALDKDRNLRYQHASEICSDLKRLKRDLEAIQAPVIVPDTGDKPAIASGGSSVSAAKAKASSGKSRAAAVPAQPDVTEAPARGLLKVLGVVGAVAMAVTLVVMEISPWYAPQETSRHQELTRRRLTSNASELPVIAAAISPDGKYLAYADDTGIYLRVIETGESHRLSAVSSRFSTSTLSWFPEGIRLVASGTAGGETTPSIWAVSILGGTPLRLRDDARGASVSPNGSQIAFLNGKATEIWMMGPNGEEPRPFVPADEGYFLLSLAWFPGSESLAYLRRGHSDKRSDVSILSRNLKESQSRAVFADTKLVSFGILSDRRMLVSLADSPAYPRGFDLWEIRTDAQTGQASGSPRRVSNWAGSTIANLSVTADGKRLAYLEGTAQYDVYTAEFEGNGRRLKRPQRLTLDDSLDIPQVWTPDGREILFSSDRNGSLDTFKQAVDQRTATAILAGPEDECDARLSPDGAWILYFDQPIHDRVRSTEPVTLRRVPFSGGPPQVVLKERGFCCVQCNASKAETPLCVVDKRVANELVFYAFDPLHGMGRELNRIPIPILHDWRVSPDGSSIAMATPERGGGIRILSLTGKPERTILVNEPVDHVLWSADGSGFYSTTVDTNAVPWAVAGGSFQKILYIGLDGHTQALWQSANFSGVYGLPSPDDRYLALGMGRMAANAWLLENF